MKIKAKLRKNTSLLQFDQCTNSELGYEDYTEAQNGILCYVDGDGYSVLFTFDEIWMSCEDFDEIFEMVI